MICDGGLGVCQVCRGAEGSLPTECPREAMTYERQMLVYNQKVDYRDGTWVKVDDGDEELSEMLERTA